MTIIIFLILLLFGGCAGIGIGYVDILPVYPDGPPPTAIHMMPTVAVMVTPTPTLNFDNPTPAPFITPQAEEVPCTIIVRQPPITAPTRMPDPMNPNAIGGQIDPHLAYCLTNATPSVGDEIKIYVRAIDLGMPAYNFIISNARGETLTIGFNPSIPDFVDLGSDLPSISFLSAGRVNSWEVIITLVANSPDTLTVTGSASGEVHFGYPGPAMWTSATLESFQMTISE